MKKIFLGTLREEFYYETTAQLAAEATKYSIRIGNRVSIGNDVSIENRVIIGNDVNIENDVKISDDVKIGDDVSIENRVSIENDVTIGNDVIIGNDVTIGSYTKIGNDVKIGSRIIILQVANIYAGIKIKKIIHLMNEYRYHVSGYSHENTIYIQMGCFTRTIEEWRADFWNNNKEFLKDSEDGILRLKAFKKICKIMEM